MPCKLCVDGVEQGWWVSLSLWARVGSGVFIPLSQESAHILLSTSGICWHTPTSHSWTGFLRRWRRFCGVSMPNRHSVESACVLLPSIRRSVTLLCFHAKSLNLTTIIWSGSPALSCWSWLGWWRRTATSRRGPLPWWDCFFFFATFSTRHTNIQFAAQIQNWSIHSAVLRFSHTQYTPFLYDYVLVAKTVENQEREAFRKQIEYIDELKKKNIKITVGADKVLANEKKGPSVHQSFLYPHRQKIINDDLVFYGIQAPKETFERYKYLLRVSDACNWSSDQNAVPLSTRWDTEDAAARPAVPILAAAQPCSPWAENCKLRESHKWLLWSVWWFNICVFFT